jgi:hypothetical protein
MTDAQYCQDHDSFINNVFFGGIAQYYDSTGILVQDTFENSVLPGLNPGRNSVIRNLKNFSDGRVFFISLETSSEKATQKIIIEQ